MKKTMLCAAVLALSVAATGCASGKKAESSAASTAAESSTATAETSAAATAAETKAAQADDADMKVPGFALGQIPEIPAVVLPELGIAENPAAKITLGSRHYGHGGQGGERSDSARFHGHAARQQR